jgi:hypothetical protein
MPKIVDLAFFSSRAKVSGFLEHHPLDSRNSAVMVVAFKRIHHHTTA